MARIRMRADITAYVRHPHNKEQWTIWDHHSCIRGFDGDQKLTDDVQAYMRRMGATFKLNKRSFKFQITWVFADIEEETVEEDYSE